MARADCDWQVLMGTLETKQLHMWLLIHMICLHLVSTNPHWASNLFFILDHGVESSKCLYYR